MREEDELGASPLLAHRRDFLILNFVLVEVGNAVDDDPGKRAAKIDNFMHQEGHNAGRQNIVLDVSVPRSPQALKHVEVDIVLGYLVELTPVGVGRGREKR